MSSRDIATDIGNEVRAYLLDTSLNRAMIYHTYAMGEKTFRVEIKIVDVTDFVKEDKE